MPDQPEAMATPPQVKLDDDDLDKKSPQEEMSEHISKESPRESSYMNEENPDQEMRYEGLDTFA